MLNSIKNFLKKPKIFIPLIIVVATIAGIFLFRGKNTASFSSVEAKRGELKQEVSVTGKVKPAQDVELSFERAGKVKNSYFKVGDEVQINQVLVDLENQDLLAQLTEYQANLEAQEASLAELKRGTRQEEIEVSRTEVANAQKALSDSQEELKKIEDKAKAEIDEDYSDAINDAAKSVTVAQNALFFIGDIQFAHFNLGDQESANFAQNKTIVVEALLGVENAGLFSNDYLSTLKGGTKGEVLKAQASSTQENIDSALLKTKDALQKIKTTLEAVQTSKLTSTESTNLSTHKSNINTEIITIGGDQQTIEVQKASNNSSIATSQAEVNSAQSALVLAQKELDLEEAGSSSEEILGQEAQVKKAQASIENIRAQIAKTILKSPINGIVTKQDAKKGEIVSASQNIVSIISKAKFEIEANVTEIDIAKVKVNDQASVTLDAYGEEVVFEARVVAIDPAETVIEGVATYKTTLEFNQEDERIKSGMTANINILADKAENVIIIPQRAVISQNGDKIVRVLKNEKEFEEKKIKTGLRGSDGNIEIIEGIEEGDKVVVFINENK